ncbi:hypothetical protein [Crateriforma spongiae]|uniref:hypothetical protein n=1 Tax=Crateriforma spongiae TaxID=2724528 RepID=UPI0014461F1E|nr:hypothetical protein [Crateriforma spongiae]
MDANPYQPPTIPNGVASHREEVARKLLAPTTGLALMLWLQLAGYVIAGTVAIATFAIGSSVGASPIEILLAFIHFFVMLYMVRSIGRVRRLSSLRDGRISAGLACIPIVTPWIWLGIPLGIWLSSILWRRSTVSAFSELRIDGG